MKRRELAAIFCILGILLIAIAPEGTFAVPDRGSKSPQAEGMPAGITVGDTGGMVANPHSDLIFRLPAPRSVWIVIVPVKRGRS